MSAMTQKFLDNLARNFVENRLDTVAENFVFPMPFYAQDSLQVFGAACTLAEALTDYRNATLRAGITKMVPRILAEGIAINGFSNIWVEWDHFDAAGTCQCTSQVHYVLHQEATALFPKIELVEYTVLAFPGVPASFPMEKIA